MISLIRRLLADGRGSYPPYFTAISVAALIVLSGCRTTSPDTDATLPGQSDVELAAGAEKIPQIQFEPVIPAITATVNDVESSDVLVAEAFGQFDNAAFDLPSRNLDAPPEVVVPEKYNLPMDMTKDIEDPEEKVEVKFNFDAESIVNVVQMFSLTLDFQYLVDPGVSGSVTMTIETEMTRQEAWELFEHILWISGGYASKQSGFINILPFAKMPQERRLFAKHDPIPNVHVEIIRLFNTTAADIAGLIKPFMTQGATASPINYLNSIMIIEAPPNMDKIRELIQQLDVVGEANWPQLSIPCKYVEAEVIVDELSQILPTIGFPVTTSEQGDGRSIKLIALDRLQVLIVAAPTRGVLTEIERWVAILDRSDTVETEQIFFYDVQYNKAEDLSDHIGVFFGSATTSSARRSNRTSTDSDTSTTSGASSRQQTNVNQRRRTPTAQRARSTDDTPTTVFDVPVTVLADGAHNRLIIRTTPRAYAMLEALLKRLDSPPKQVLIQALIVKVELNEPLNYGVSFQTIREFGNKAATIALDSNGLVNVKLSGKASGVPSSDAAAIITSADGIADIGDVFASIVSSAGPSNVSILNAPQIIAISDEEATINVGDSIPIATESSTSSNDLSRTSIQYQDTGVILTVTPHIAAKKLVTLDLRQEVSTLGATTAAPDAIQSLRQSPPIETTVVETSMLIQDGSTLMMGGFISSTTTDNKGGLPILKDIPYLGKLFSKTDHSVERSELIILITVKVIDLDTDLDLLLKRYKTTIDTIDAEFGVGNFDKF